MASPVTIDMGDKRWKATERKIAALLGGRRVPVSGRGRGDAPDIARPWLALEVKDRATCGEMWRVVRGIGVMRMRRVSVV